MFHFPIKPHWSCAVIRTLYYCINCV